MQFQGNHSNYVFTLRVFQRDEQHQNFAPEKFGRLVRLSVVRLEKRLWSDLVVDLILVAIEVETSFFCSSPTRYSAWS